MEVRSVSPKSSPCIDDLSQMDVYHQCSDDNPGRHCGSLHLARNSRKAKQTLPHGCRSGSGGQAPRGRKSRHREGKHNLQEIPPPSNFQGLENLRLDFLGYPILERGVDVLRRLSSLAQKLEAILHPKGQPARDHSTCSRYPLCALCEFQL